MSGEDSAWKSVIRYIIWSQIALALKPWVASSILYCLRSWSGQATSFEAGCKQQQDLVPFAVPSTQCFVQQHIQPGFCSAIQKKKKGKNKNPSNLPVERYLIWGHCKLFLKKKNKKTFKVLANNYWVKLNEPFRTHANLVDRKEDAVPSTYFFNSEVENIHFHCIMPVGVQEQVEKIILQNTTKT